jgi:hypothetical protein
MAGVACPSVRRDDVTPLVPVVRRGRRVVEVEHRAQMARVVAVALVTDEATIGARVVDSDDDVRVGIRVGAMADGHLVIRFAGVADTDEAGIRSAPTTRPATGIHENLRARLGRWRDRLLLMVEVPGLGGCCLGRMAPGARMRWSFEHRNGPTGG